MAPQARHDQLVVQELGDETIIYDEQHNHIHRLNQTAALVWRHCDGQRKIGDLALVVQNESGLPMTEEMVWLALDRLEKEHLLQDRLVRPEAAGQITRRQMLRKAALVGGATLLLPVVQSIIAPTPAMALSIGCATRGQTVQPGRPCCNGLTEARGGRCVPGLRGQ